MKVQRYLAICLVPLCSAVLVGCDVERRDAGRPGLATERSTGQKMDDKQLSSTVKDALDDNVAYKFPTVEVNTYEGKVQLSGFVATREQKDKAEEIAKAIAGAGNVENKITVRE